jgi:hypothetical protein
MSVHHRDAHEYTDTPAFSLLVRHIANQVEALLAR